MWNWTYTTRVKEEDMPPKPKPLKTRMIYDSPHPPRFRTVPVKDDDLILNTKWVLPFIFGAMIGFWICSVMF